jgi:voltage-gated potassium channel
VFVVDLAVRMRHLRDYLHTGVGVFDLVVVILTAPWFLIPGFGASQVLMLARLGRLARLLLVSPKARQALQRLGRVGLFALAMILFASWMAYTAEKATNPEFATYGDAVWWGIVTLTTVGYGDIVPETTPGRVAGVFLMVTGLATLGIISGTMASLFRSSNEETATPTSGAGETDRVVAELSALRTQLAALEQRLAGDDGTRPDVTGSPGATPPG